MIAPNWARIRAASIGPAHHPVRFDVRSPFAHSGTTTLPTTTGLTGPFLKALFMPRSLCRFLALAGRKLLSDRRANVAVIFGTTFTAMFVIVAAALDYGQLLAARQRLQSTMDAALLHAIRDRVSGKTLLAQQYFTAEIGTSDVVNAVSFYYTAAARDLSGTATVNVPSSIGSAWRDSTPVTVSGHASAISDKVRALDIAICVNASAGATSIVSTFLAASLGLNAYLELQFAAIGMPSFDQIRVRPIYYRDYGGFATQIATINAGVTSGVTSTDPTTMGTASGDAADQILQGPSTFFDISSGAGPLWTYANSIVASGGGDLQDSGLECVNEAMDSPWANVGDVTSKGSRIDMVYPVIAVVPWAAAHPLNFMYSVQNPNYPPVSKMPRDDATFLSKWMNRRSAQPNLSIWMMGSLSPHPPLALPDKTQVAVTNGFASLVNWPGYAATTMPVTSTGYRTSLAQSVAEAYSKVLITQ
jgi:Flp pilus assembly protein TadG